MPVLLYNSDGRKEQWMTTLEFAKEMGVSRQRVHVWISMGLEKLPIGNIVLIPVARGKAWVKETFNRY